MSNILFHCAKYGIKRDTLERKLEDILFREGCNDITCIDLKPLYNENISKNAQNYY